MRFAPMAAPADFDIQRHVQFERRFGGAGHHRPDDRCSLFLAPVGDFEHQFVLALSRLARSSDPNSSIAVRLWMSALSRNASFNAGTSAMCAASRNSIWL